jgi:membrane protease YdiL (CAAX protease family)
MEGGRSLWGVSIKTFFVLWLAGLAGVAAVIPYALTLQREVLQNALPSTQLLALASLAQSAVWLAIAAFLGLRLLGSCGYTLVPTKPYVWLSILLGFGVAAAIVVAEAGFVYFSSYTGLPDAKAPNWWQGLLASLYGGISEEILLRLFLMTLVAWVIGRISKRSAQSPAVAWSAIVIAAVLFGVGHLPAVAQLGPISAIVVVRTVSLNAVGGAAFGWLYWRRGLISAMLAHFSADIVLLVIVPIGSRYLQIIPN